MVMKLRKYIESFSDFRFIIENLELESSFSKQILFEKPFLTNKKEIENQYNRIKSLLNSISRIDFLLNDFKREKHRLCELRDIRGTISRLESGAILDDIELFEIKSLALTCSKINTLLLEFKLDEFTTITIDQVLSLLDPEGKNIGSFYVYDAYSQELRELRSKYKQNPENSDLLDAVFNKESEIRASLSKEISKDVELIKEALFSLAELDILIAKTVQVVDFKLTIPKIEDGLISYQNMFHPKVEASLLMENKQFQPINIKLDNMLPVLITGANMGGKSVVLKTLALNQILFQFGFGIPAETAQISIVESIHFCSGDDQNIERGLSSFAAEILKINKVLEEIRRGKRILALIDEPARTTNPEEGTALSESLVDMLKQKNVLSVVTTHYNVSNNKCLRYRVKGIENGKMNYTLIETDTHFVPKEAINIAKTLGVDEEWVRKTEEILSLKLK